MKSGLSLTLLSMTMLSCAGIGHAQTKTTGHLTIDGISRSFIIYMPKTYSATAKAPVIFLFHGGGATANSMLNISDESDFKSISDRENVLLVAPEGISKSWNDGRATKANKKDIDDVKFIDSLLQYMESTYAVDAARIYATGISNGGFMVSRLGCERGAKFAAIAVVAATMGVDIPYAGCAPDCSLPVMYIHGTADPLIPFNGGEKSIGAEGAFVSHQQAIEKWVAVNKANPTPVVTQLPDISADGTSVTRAEYRGGKEGAVVIGYTINNGGHTWPGGRQYLPKMLVGRVCKDMNGCEVIWDFFKHCRR